MELARHSDLRLTMRNYTDAGQLPLREVMESLPSLGAGADSRIDSRTLVPAGQTGSPVVPETTGPKAEKTPENIDESRGESALVTVGPEKSNWRRGGDSNPRYAFKTYTGLANQRLQPLGHLSTAAHSEARPRPALK